MRRYRQIGVFLIRLGLLSGATGLLLALPDPAAGSVLPMKNAAVAVVAVIMVGKLIYDTFFYPRRYL